MLRPVTLVIIAGTLFYVFDDTLVSLALGLILLVLATFVAGVAIARGIAVRRFLIDCLGGDSEGLTKLRAMTGRLFLGQRTATYSAANALFLFVGIPYLGIAIFLGLNWWSIPAVLAAFLFNMAWRQLYPPVAVFLSTSRKDQIELCAKLQYRMFPQKVVNMLAVEAS